MWKSPLHPSAHKGVEMDRLPPAVEIAILYRGLDWLILDAEDGGKGESRHTAVLVDGQWATAQDTRLEAGRDAGAGSHWEKQ